MDSSKMEEEDQTGPQAPPVSICQRMKMEEKDFQRQKNEDKGGTGRWVHVSIPATSDMRNTESSGTAGQCGVYVFSVYNWPYDGMAG